MPHLFETGVATTYKFAGSEVVFQFDDGAGVEIFLTYKDNQFRTFWSAHVYNYIITTYKASIFTQLSSFELYFGVCVIAIAVQKFPHT